jgi:hypothetical protein
LSRLAETFGQTPTSLVDDLDGRLWPVNVGKLIFNPGRTRVGPIHEDIYERFAQSVHHTYLRRQLARGVSLGDTASMVPWERLDGTGLGADLDDDAEVESLAIAEHDRWLTERISHGWTFGEVRDEVAKTHPSIRPWCELSEAERDKDRDAVRDIPLVLADFGLRLVRLPQRMTNAMPQPEVRSQSTQASGRTGTS